MTKPNCCAVRLPVAIAPVRSILLIIMMLFMIIPCVGQDMPIPANVQYALIAKILAYDKSLNGGGKNEVVIGILFQSGFRMSRTTKDELVAAAIEGSPAKNANGMSVRFVPIEVDNEINLPDLISPTKLDALYVTPLRAIDIETIVTMSRRKQIITLTGVPEYADQGIAVSIGVRDERPLIIVNLPAAKAEGADLSSQLLKVSKVIQ